MNINEQLTLPESVSGMRLDAALAMVCPDYSRAQLGNWIKSRQVSVDGKTLAPKYKVVGGESVHIQAEIVTISNEPEDIKLDIIYEDDDILVINKPYNLVMYPAAGHPRGTLMNAILHHLPDNNHLPRAGIIHRLDKDTTGLCIIAKSLIARNKLVDDLQLRKISRHYQALVKGEVIAGSTINAPIARHPSNRTKMAVASHGKSAVTHYRIGQKFANFTLLNVTLETGRTHQIRVHLSHIGFPIVGDTTYGWRTCTPKGISHEAKDKLQNFKRQALHAYKLVLNHPVTGEKKEFTAPLPKDYSDLIKFL